MFVVSFRGARTFVGRPFVGREIAAGSKHKRGGNLHPRSKRFIEKLLHWKMKPSKATVETSGENRKVEDTRPTELLIQKWA